MGANIQKLIFILLFLGSVFSCASDDGNNTLSCIPRPTISVSIDRSLAAYQNLNSVGGWVYYNGELAGDGLIVVNTSTGIKAYDRNAPHICPTSNSLLKVENDITIVCEEDGAEWILSSGQPITIAGRSPITYFVNVNGSLVNITN